jgi:hypothetical protein
MYVDADLPHDREVLALKGLGITGSALCPLCRSHQVLATSMAHSSGCGCRRCGLAKLKRVVHCRLLRRQVTPGRCASTAVCMLACT